jgi:stage V sporulation protein R
MKKLLPMDNEWTFEKLEIFDRAISKIAKEDFLLDTYENQIEIITAQQMIEAYSSNGIPINYAHWSFGKKAFQLEKQYKSGKMGSKQLT